MNAKQEAETQQLPYLVGAVLCSIVDPESLKYAGSGFRDVTSMVPHLTPSEGAAFLMQNREAVLASIDTLLEQLQDAQNGVNMNLRIHDGTPDIPCPLRGMLRRGNEARVKLEQL